MTPLSGQKVSKLFIDYEITGIKFTDSLNLAKKQYSLNKKLSQPVAATLYTDNETIKSQSIFLANNVLQVNINDTSVFVNKTKLQEEFLFLTANDRIRPNYFPLYGELNANNDTVGLKKLSIIFDSLMKDDIKKSYNYFKSNKSSLLSLFAFSRSAAFASDYSKVEKDFMLLPLWARNTPDGKSIALKIQGAKSAQINTPAKDFTLMSSTGQKISLKDFKGKYVLLDFWASWCGPCRKEHPNLIKAYEQFNQKNFEIISISLDNDKSSWLEAIKKDKINWTNISDLKGQQNEIALKYGVQAIPANFLINPDGIIIKKDLNGQLLIDKLNTLLK